MKLKPPSKIIFGGIGLILAIPALLLLIKQKIGDVRPAILPPSRNIAETNTPNQPQQPGSALDFPLKVPAGFEIGIFAKDLGSARDLEYSPGGVLLVSSPSTGTVYALPDRNNDGKADEVKPVITNLNSPHGLAFHNGKLFIAESTQLARYNWDENNLKATFDKTLMNLPTGNHSAHTIIFDKTGRLFVKIGSSCNVCVEDRGLIKVTDQNGNNPKTYATGLRNAPFMVFNPKTDDLWVTEMGRDYLGDNLPPDEINIVKEGKNYGWPYCYGNKVHDDNFDKRPIGANFCGQTEAPIFEIPAHNAPLGLAFIESSQFPSEWQGDLLVALHGSWNSSVLVGYKVVHLKVNGNTITDSDDFITGFLSGSSALGRPVDLLFDKNGSLYLSDDKAGVIYKIVKK